MKYLQQKYPTKQKKHLQQDHSNKFANWLEQEVYSLYKFVFLFNSYMSSYQGNVLDAPTKQILCLL